jgi:hypothetical protein
MKSSFQNLISFFTTALLISVVISIMQLQFQETPSVTSSAGLGSSLYSLGADTTENTVPILIVQQYLDSCLSVAAGTCLPSRFLKINVYHGSTIPTFRRHVTIIYCKDTEGRCEGLIKSMYQHLILEGGCGRVTKYLSQNNWYAAEIRNSNIYQKPYCFS